MQQERWLQEQQVAELARERLRLVDGRPYHEHVDEVRALIKQGEHEEAAGRLLRLIEAVELEHAVPLAGRTALPPWYYRQLAEVYRRLGRSDLAAKVMQRYEAVNADVERTGFELLQRQRELFAEPPEKRAMTKVSEGAGRAVGAAVSSFLRLVSRR